MAWKPDYITAAQLKSFLKIGHDNDDLWLANWVTAVSRNVDDFCGRQFGQVASAETRYYSAIWDRNERRTYFEIDDLQDITSLTFTDSNSNLITDYRLEPRNAIAKGGVYTSVSMPVCYSADISSSGKWGWNAIPASIPTAAYIQASRLSARRSSPFGIAGSPQDGSELRLLAQLDPDFKTSLKPYIRKWYAR